MWKPRTVTDMESAIKAVVKCHILSTQLLGLSNQYYSLDGCERGLVYTFGTTQLTESFDATNKERCSSGIGLPSNVTVALGYDGFLFLVIVCRLSCLSDILCGHCLSSADGHTIWNL